jgi:tRNA A37 N6-isopentenylltransferase MiaA
VDTPGRRYGSVSISARTTTGVGSRDGRASSSTAGLVDEAVALRERYDPSLPAFSAIGYQEAWAVADGEITRDVAVERDTRRNIAFAKRQRTWFRAERDVTWLDATDPFDQARELARGLID